MRNCVKLADPRGPGSIARRRGNACTGFSCRRAWRLPFAALILALIAVALSPLRAEDEAIESQRRDLEGVEQRVRDLEEDLSTRRERRENLLAELEQHERDIGDLARAGHQLKEMIAEQEQALGKLRGRLAVERDALVRERAALGTLLRSVYAMGPGDRIRMLLDQEDSNRLSRVMAYYDFLNRFRLERLEAIAQRARKLESLSREVEGEKERLSSLAQKQDETRTRMASAQEERAAVLASLERTIATRAEGIEDLRVQAAEMRGLLEQLEQRARELPEAELHQEPLKHLRGSLSWPLADASLVSRFGSPKEEGSQRWDGVILKAEEGAEVHAVHPGQVIYADWLRGFGLLIIIEHDDGYMTLYGNNQTLLKETGEWVAAGDPIALSGRSGGRTSPGLYFAIRHRGRPLNPEQWCRRGAAGGGRTSAAGSPAMERRGVSLLKSRESPRTPVTSGICFAVDLRIYPPVTSL